MLDAHGNLEYVFVRKIPVANDDQNRNKICFHEIGKHYGLCCTRKSIGYERCPPENFSALTNIQYGACIHAPYPILRNTR
jgi:hypothetical protein